MICQGNALAYILGILPWGEKMSYLNENLDTSSLPEMKLLDNRLRELTGSRTRAMKEIGDYVLNLGGKRIRPLLVLLCSDIYRANLRARLDVAVAAELIHTASLLHDDIVDAADFRRGQPSVNSRWGNPSSVLAGDFLFAKAFTILSRYPGPLEVMTAAIASMSEGELVQLSAHFDPDLSPETYIETIAGKTASLLAASCQCGGMISTMPAAQVNALSTFGLHLGIAYQIIDDIGDYVLADSQSGKQKGIDIQNGIITLPIMYVLANPHTRGRAMEIISSRQSLLPGALSRELAKTCALEKSGAAACQHIESGLSQLRDLPLCRPTIMLRNLAIQLRERCRIMLDHSAQAQGIGQAFQHTGP